MAERVAGEPVEDEAMTEGETRGAIFTRGAIDETTVRIVDALFRHFAKQVSPKNGISIEDAIDASWLLLERGSLRLVNGDDGHLAVEPCGENRTERRAQARKNRPLIEFRHRMARGGSVLRAHAHEV
jgi:hypothetical protein